MVLVSSVQVSFTSGNTEKQEFFAESSTTDWRVSLEQSRDWITDQLSTVISKAGIPVGDEDLEVEDESDDESATSSKRIK